MYATFRTLPIFRRSLGGSVDFSLPPPPTVSPPEIVQNVFSRLPLAAGIGEPTDLLFSNPLVELPEKF